MEINNYDSVANLYDTYVPATFDIDFFIQETRKSPGEVLELMSGTGRVSIPLLEAGVRLTCVDISAESNKILAEKLRQKGLRAALYCMDVRDLDLPGKFAMAILPFHSFAHLTSPGDQRQALDRIRQHLLPGGTFICTLANPALRQKTVDGQLRLFRRYPLPGTGGVLLLWITEKSAAADPRVVEAAQLYEEYDAGGLLQSKRLLELRFRLTSRDEFEALAGEAGFRVKALYGDYAYAQFDHESPCMIWLLENAG